MDQFNNWSLSGEGQDSWEYSTNDFNDMLNDPDFSTNNDLLMTTVDFDTAFAANSEAFNNNATLGDTSVTNEIDWSVFDFDQMMADAGLDQSDLTTAPIAPPPVQEPVKVVSNTPEISESTTPDTDWSLDSLFETEEDLFGDINKPHALEALPSLENTAALNQSNAAEVPGHTTPLAVSTTQSEQDNTLGPDQPPQTTITTLSLPQLSLSQQRPNVAQLLNLPQPKSSTQQPQLSLPRPRVNQAPATSSTLSTKSSSTLNISDVNSTTSTSIEGGPSNPAPLVNPSKPTRPRGRPKSSGKRPSSDVEDPEAPKAKKARPFSCDECRKAKGKCDHVQPACGLCSKKGIRCTFSMVDKRTNETNQQELSELVQQRRGLLIDFLSLLILLGPEYRDTQLGSAVRNHLRHNRNPSAIITFAGLAELPHKANFEELAQSISANSQLPQKRSAKSRVEEISNYVLFQLWDHIQDFIRYDVSDPADIRNSSITLITRDCESGAWFRKNETRYAAIDPAKRKEQQQLHVSELALSTRYSGQVQASDLATTRLAAMGKSSPNGSSLSEISASDRTASMGAVQLTDIQIRAGPTVDLVEDPRAEPQGDVQSPIDPVFLNVLALQSVTAVEDDGRARETYYQGGGEQTQQ